MKLTRNVFGSLRGLSVLLTVCFLILGGILPSAALAGDRSAKKDPVAAEDASYTVWTYDAGKDALIADYGSSKETYTPVGTLPDRIRFVGLDFFIYADSTSHGESVRAPYYKSRYVMLGDGTALATESGHRELEKLAKGALLADLRLYASTGYYTAISKTFFENLANADDSGAVSRTLFDLRDVQCYEILSLADGDWYGTPLGYVFETEEGLFFADARELSDDCFGSDATLLPKTTATLSLIPLSDNLEEQVYNKIFDVEIHFTSYEYEKDYNADYDLDDIFGGVSDAHEDLMFATVIILGILLPIAPLAVGLSLPHSRKLGYKKRWYLLAILGAAWMVLGFLVLLLMLLV